MSPESKEERSQLLLRVSQTDRDQLKEAANARGVSVNREAITRLRASFAQESFDGGPAAELRGVLQLVSMVMLQAANATMAISQIARGPDNSWLDNPLAYDQAVRAAIAVLERFRPAGDKSPKASAAPLFVDAASAEKIGGRLADSFIDLLLSEEEGEALALNRVRENLGHLLERLKAPARAGQSK